MLPRNKSIPSPRYYLTQSNAAPSTLASDDVFYRIVSTNVSYLAISITVLLGLSALGALLFHFFTLKPQQERLDKQEKEMKEMEDRMIKDVKNQILEQEKRFAAQQIALTEVETRINDDFKKQFLSQQNNFTEIVAELRADILKAHAEELSSLKVAIDAKIGQLDAKSKSLATLIESTKLTAEGLEESLKVADAIAEWTEHYMWGARGVFQNEILCIITAIQKTLILKNPLNLELFIKVLEETLSRPSAESVSDKHTTEVMETMKKIIDSPQRKSLHGMAENIIKLVNKSSGQKS